ncbi:FAD-dependent oxidoreductase [Natronosporangium hydrolyticum]|uniref:FAD-dependent oxidoreductase n=1 Tax=Natronosporangium hydrolyticum TaxID=2811111 RepID=A0A895YDQ5_9ACTN|nr:FAD-dependent oxidoreductase [Natronosporangium hydrolyticum]QSB15934.1 FAD-dependent oxidoreductase [Natronosporangium hydrolyticum]
MKDSKLVVVGASLAGLRTVEAARLAGHRGAITLVGAEPHLPYDRPPLSKDFLSGMVEPPYFRGVESLRTELGVDLQLGAPATALDLAAGTVTVGGDLLRYDGLVLATGARARPLPAAGRHAGVHTLRTLDDAWRLRRALVPGAQAVIVGAGCIGIEVAYAAIRRGARPVVVEAEPVPMSRAVGAELGAALAGVIRGHGINLRCGVTVESFGGTDRLRSVRLSDGTELPADLLIVGIGAAPETGWLADSGLTIDDGVVCDEALNAGAPGVYAAGDIARWFNPVFAAPMRLENWTTAAEQAALAARNAVDPAAARPCRLVPYLWSDWGTDRLQFVGLPDAEEVAMVVGAPEAGRFLAMYRRGARVIGGLGLNHRRAILQLRTAIANGAGWAASVREIRERWG